MKRFFSFLAVVTAATAISFDSSTVRQNNLENLLLLNRLYLPYGPDQTIDPPQASTEPYAGFGYGLRGVENFVYDITEKYLYALSHQRYVTIVDYSGGAFGDAIITDYSIDLTDVSSSVDDIAICDGYIFVSLPGARIVQQYSTVKRSNPKKPKLFASVTAGHFPGKLSASPGCKYIAVANEGKGSPTQTGEVHLISEFTTASGAKVEEIQFAGYTDSMLLKQDVHMPLSEKAMEYWDLHSNQANDIDWTALRGAYASDLFFKPAAMTWSDDESRLFVNLQENSAVVDIDVSLLLAVSVKGYGLKQSTASPGMDIINDGGCSHYVKSPILSSLRAPSQIASVEIDGVQYLLTADTGGSGFSFEDFNEQVVADSVFQGESLGMRKMVTVEDFFDEINPGSTQSALFNRDCGTFSPAPSLCAPKLEMSLGSSAINFENPEFPKLNKVVAFGGRGMSIFKVPPTGNMTLTWDSGHEFEEQGCAAFKWAHNSIQDETFASTAGPLFALSDGDFRDVLIGQNDPAKTGCADRGDGVPGACAMGKTVDSLASANGLAPQAIVVGEACGRLFSAVCSKHNSNCYIYDISNIKNPVLKEVLNLSRASSTRSPEVAYEERNLGEIDVKTILFLSPKDGPVNKPTLMISGALSSSIVLYEFTCTIQPTMPPVPTSSPTLRVTPPPTRAATPVPTPFPTPTAFGQPEPGSQPTPFPTPTAFGSNPQPTRNPVFSSSSTSTEGDKDEGLGGGAIAGIVLVVMFGGAFMIVGILYMTGMSKLAHIEEMDALDTFQHGANESVPLAGANVRLV